MVFKRKFSILVTMFICLIALFGLTSCKSKENLVDSLNKEELIIYNQVKECYSNSDYQPYVLDCREIRYNSSNEGGYTFIKLTCMCYFWGLEPTRAPYWYMIEWSNSDGTELDWTPTRQNNQEDQHYERTYDPINGDIDKINDALTQYYKEKGWI